MHSPPPFRTIVKIDDDDTGDVLDPDLFPDPDLLCPFCDERLPDEPSLVLTDLLRRARARSYPTPRLGNRKALRAPFMVYVDVCTRHRFESIALPRALCEGWPTEIDFSSLPSRLENEPVKSRLDSVVSHPTTSLFFLDFMGSVVRHGIRVAESSFGQYSTFEDVQPGYYGGRGSMIISHLMFNFYLKHFPSLKLRIYPVSISTFIHSVLVPEAALALAMDDQHCDANAARTILRTSSSYGSQMFPDLDDDPVVGRLTYARALQARKEREEEQVIDMELDEPIVISDSEEPRPSNVILNAPIIIIDSDSDREDEHYHEDISI